MTPSNLDLVRECWARIFKAWDCEEIQWVSMTPAQLDAFAERIRADALTEYAASAKAPTESPRCSEPLEMNIYAVTSQAAGNVMSINYMDESGKLWRYCSKCHAHSPAEVGCAHFTAAPAPPAPQPLPQERKLMTECPWEESDPCGDMPCTYESSCGELWSFIDGGPKENNVKFCHGCGYPVVVTPFQTENENGITAQQGGGK